MTFYKIYDFTKYEQEKNDKEKAREYQEIYRGIYSPEVVSSSVIDTNIAIMKSITSKVSKANKDNFIENLKQNLDPTLLSYVKIVQGDEKPYVDKFGRETNYYIMIDSKRIWLY